jgi:predicted GNAT family acetyltransferase
MPFLDHQANNKDFDLLKNDFCTFAVLARILKDECELILTDHERFLLCHSAARYPVWIWTPDGASEEEKNRAWRLAQEARPLAQGFRYNLKYELAEHFIEKAKGQGLNAGIAMNLMAYDCPAPVRPAHAADGGMYCCAEKDAEEAALMIGGFHTAIGDGAAEEAYCRQKAEEHIAANAFFFWKNAQGKAVACCSYRPDGALASLGSVYTLPEYRRMHYAENLVYQVTQRVKEQGFMPILYTDADYAASNACYSKIGYQCRGRLCTLAAL